MNILLLIFFFCFRAGTLGAGGLSLFCEGDPSEALASVSGDTWSISVVGQCQEHFSRTKEGVTSGSVNLA